MYQRIQTLYLFLAAALGALLFIAPVSIYMFKEESISYKAFQLQTASESILIKGQDIIVPLLVGVSIAISLLTIFLFKNRPLQIKLARLTVLVVMTVIALILFYIEKIVSGYLAEPHAVYLWGAYIPFVQILFLLLAVRAVKKDEELVKAADRIR